MNLNGPANTLLRSIGKPAFIYGTAWKKEATASLVQDALAAGFTAIDTAAQPKHYREDLVGQGMRAAFMSGAIRRDDIFVSQPVQSASSSCICTTDMRYVWCNGCSMPVRRVPSYYTRHSSGLATSDT